MSAPCGIDSSSFVYLIWRDPFRVQVFAPPDNGGILWRLSKRTRVIEALRAGLHLYIWVIYFRNIFSIGLPFASSSTSLSKYLTCFVRGFLMSSMRYPQMTPVMR